MLKEKSSIGEPNFHIASVFCPLIEPAENTGYVYVFSMDLCGSFYILKLKKQLPVGRSVEIELIQNHKKNDSLRLNHEEYSLCKH